MKKYIFIALALFTLWAEFKAVSNNLPTSIIEWGIVLLLTVGIILATTVLVINSVQK